MVTDPTNPLKPGKHKRVALIGETAKDVRDVMVEGDSGILSCHPKEFRPLYEPSKARLTWPNGATATLYNATEPDQLRGPQFDLAWLDELAKWDRQEEAWDMLQFGLRLGAHPRQIITTTPRPTPLVKRLAFSSDGTVHVTKGSTFDNKTNLAPSFFKEVIAQYEGTRLGQQELYADLLLDVPGALWTSEMLEQNRCRDGKIPDMVRVSVAIDPSVSERKDDSLSECGIVVVGLGDDGLGYVLHDGSGVLSPSQWGRRALSLYDRYQADRIVIEINQGGDMVYNVLRSVDHQGRNAAITKVRATRGKYTRAEPIAALYEQNRIRHVGRLPELEVQMMAMTPAGHISGEKTDRVDALVWGLTDLFRSPVNKVDLDKDFEEDRFSAPNYGSAFGVSAKDDWLS